MGSSIIVIPKPQTAAGPVQGFIVATLPVILGQTETPIQWNMAAAFKNTITGATGQLTSVSLPKGLYTLNMHIPIESSGISDTFAIKAFLDGIETTTGAAGTQSNSAPITQQNGQNRTVLTFNSLLENGIASSRPFSFNIVRLYGENFNNSFSRIPDGTGLMQIARLGDTA